MDRYEISLWEDFSDVTSDGKIFLNERKIAVIGSDTMTAQARALEPNLIEEINGTNTFTFKMYYTYTDNQTGEKYANPFGKYLINERKVKVHWKDKWYDLVIKKCQEDSSKKSVTYICKDLFINELSKQGYSLVFDTDLQNNIGTATELAEKVLEGSTWQYDNSASEPIIQRTEGPVYEVITTRNFTATKQSAAGDESSLIPGGSTILVFYDSLVNLLGITKPTGAQAQFLYAEEYETDANDMVVTNGDCYIADFSFSKVNNILIASVDNNSVFSINLDLGVSERYRAKRLVRSQRSEYDPLLERYVLLCEDADGREVYEIATTEYSNPLLVTNLIVNPNNFVNTAGWIGEVDSFGVYPKYGPNTELSTYEAKSYLKLNQGLTYNTCIQSNISYFTPNDTDKKQGRIGGIQKGEKYVFRIKAKLNVNNAPNNDYIQGDGLNNIGANLRKYTQDTNGNFILSDKIFSSISKIATSEGWIEFTLKADISVSLNELNEYGFFIQNSFDSGIWVEDIQFFKYEEGATSYAEDAEIHRINPGEINLQSIVTPVYKYYYKNVTSDANDLTFLYVGEIESNDYAPIYNNYEKIGTITEKESNRFNILQSIAEAFSAWVRFRIDHDDNGAISIINGVPQKFVYFIEEVGQDTGLSFEYGIDLKTVSRSIDSDNLATKIIINPNTNEFASQGFCSIARSDENYSKENFILNLDYFVQQNILNKEELNKDLYSTSEEYIGYYYWLHLYNSEYDDLTDVLLTKNLDLIKQISEQKIYQQYIVAASQQLESIESDLINLADVSQWADVEMYAKANANNEKVQALLNSHSEVENQIKQYQNSLEDINSSINLLQEFINNSTTRQEQLIELIKAKHKEFDDKYTNYIMEGTWQDDNYVDDNKYYLDGLNIAYTSSRPQLSYTINVLRLSSLEEYSSKIFNLGDICYIQDTEFFGYLSDKITPYKERILISKVSSFFDSPEKDVLTVQNYKTRFDDLFQRVAAATQNLEYKEGSFTRAADSINADGTINLKTLQDTLNENSDLVLNASNQDVVWDDTGITVTDKFNIGNKTKILAGGIFITNDGGVTWKNAIRGNGISTELLVSGRINTNKIYIYDGSAPSFRWDSYGLTAYSYDNEGVKFNKFVRFDKYGLYGYEGITDFIPASEEDIKNNANFGLTWGGFFLKSTSGEGQDVSTFEISTTNDLVITKGNIKRVQLGRIDDEDNEKYGMKLYDSNQNEVFSVDTDTSVVKMAGWTVEPQALYYGDTSSEMYISQGGISVTKTNETLAIGGDHIFSLQYPGYTLDESGLYSAPWNINNGQFKYNDKVLKFEECSITNTAGITKTINILCYE